MKRQFIIASLFWLILRNRSLFGRFLFCFACRHLFDPVNKLVRHGVNITLRGIIADFADLLFVFGFRCLIDKIKKIIERVGINARITREVLLAPDRASVIADARKGQCTVRKLPVPCLYRVNGIIDAVNSNLIGNFTRFRNSIGLDVPFLFNVIFADNNIADN